MAIENTFVKSELKELRVILQVKLLILLGK
jgi:hypothetical protein